MKLKTLAAAIASIGALAAANQAAALVPTDANTATNKVFLAGSSALDPQLTTLIRTQICNGDLITMSNGTTAPGTAQTAYLCTVNGSQIPGLSGQTLVIYKRASGGSAYGVGPVLNPSASASVARLDPNGCSTTPVDSTDPVKHYTCATTVNDTPIGGISDVEPNLFVGPNLLVNLPEAPQPAGAPGTVDVIDDGGYTTATLDAVTFGVEVTTNLRNALQDAQVSIGKLPTGCVGQETEECMPSLSRTEVASIFSGAVASWDKFMVGNQPLTSFGTAGTNTKINACRRSPGSGTQAQYNALFSNAPCTGGANPPLRDNTSFTWRIANAGSGPAQHNNIGTTTGMNGVPTTLPAIHEGQGAGDVERCMELLNTSTVTRWGIGLNALDRGQGNNGLSLPTDPNNLNAGAKDYVRFIKVDGVAPTLANVANNKYFDWSGASIQWRTSAYAGGVNNVPNANQLLVLNKIRTDAVTPTDLASSNALIELPAGSDYKVGNLVFPSATNVASFPFSVSNPVITSQRVAGGKPNTCVTASIINQGGL